MGDCSSSYSRPLELNSRFSLRLQSSFDRMESGPFIISSPSLLLSSASGRSVCHLPECTAPGICVPNARQLGFSPGCHVPGLEPMVLDLPVSSSESSLADPPKTQFFKGLAILIAAEWKNSPWFSVLSSLCRKFPLPNPILSQKVRGKSFCSPSFLVQSLRT